MFLKRVLEKTCLFKACTLTTTGSTQVSLVHTLNAVRGCLVDEEGRFFDVYSPLLPWDDAARRLELVDKRKREGQGERGAEMEHGLLLYC